MTDFKATSSADFVGMLRDMLESAASDPERVKSVMESVEERLLTRKKVRYLPLNPQTALHVELIPEQTPPEDWGALEDRNVTVLSNDIAQELSRHGLYVAISILLDEFESRYARLPVGKSREGRRQKLQNQIARIKQILATVEKKTLEL